MGRLASFRKFWIMVSLIGTFGARFGLAQDSSARARTNTTAGNLSNRIVPTNSAVPISIKETSPGVFKIADVRLDKLQRTVSFPARLNLTNGAMEYLLVNSWGKVHESVFQTETEPYRIHVAMLLLGVNSMEALSKSTTATNLVEASSPGQFLSHPSAERLPGEAISIEVKWLEQGRRMSRPAEQFLFNRKTKSMPRDGDWVYNGSIVQEGHFLAESEGSVVSLVTDPLAMINNLAPGHDDDSIWFVNTNRLPPLETALEIVIHLKSSSRK